MFGLTGEVRRRCIFTADMQVAEWNEPDFSGCFTSGFLSLKKKVSLIVSSLALYVYEIFIV